MCLPAFNLGLRGIARGAGGLSPLSQKPLPPPMKWHFVQEELPFWVPVSPPHFEKAGYTLWQTTWVAAKPEPNANVVRWRLQNNIEWHMPAAYTSCAKKKCVSEAILISESDVLTTTFLPSTFMWSHMTAPLQGGVVICMIFSGFYGLLIMSSLSCCVYFMPICFAVWYWKKVGYDMIWYDMIWYDMIWYMMRYDMIWYMIWWYGMIWYDEIWYMIRYDMIWYEIWYDEIWYDIWWDMILLVIPCLFMQYEKILMVWVCITRGWKPSVIRTQTINIVRIAWEQTGGNEFITQ